MTTPPPEGSPQRGTGLDGSGVYGQTWPQQPWQPQSQWSAPQQPLAAAPFATDRFEPQPFEPGAFEPRPVEPERSEHAYPWPATDGTMQLGVLADPAEAGPPPGGRAERRRAAQGRGAVRSGTGHRRAGGGGAGAGPRPKEPVAVVAARSLGELFITFGVVLLLFVAYQLWWTNVQADAQAAGARNKLEQQWSAKPAPGAATPSPGAFQPGQGFAIIYLPKLGKQFPIAEGVGKTEVLDKGLVGHYPGTGMPSDATGNFALAAHRNTHGEPFRYINHLTLGDKVVVETAQSYYTYQVTSIIPSTPPTNVSVILPVPKGSGFTQPGRYITLTTCTPEFTSKYRLIVFGKLIDERPRAQGQPPALTGQ